MASQFYSNTARYDEKPRRTPAPSSARSERLTSHIAHDASRPFFGQAAPVLQPQHQPDIYQPNMRVVSAGGQAQQQDVSSLTSTAMKMAALVIVLVAVLSFARIALTSSSVTTMLKSDALSTQISEARSAGTALEMEQSVLKNPSAVAAQARQLSMVAPTSAATIILEPDVVAINNDDTLSLSDTIKNVAQAGQ